MSVLDDLLIRVSSDTNEAEQGVKGLTGFVDKHMTKIVAITAGAGLLMAKGLNDALNVEAGADKLAAQLDLTAAESGRIGGIAGELYADAYGSSMEEVNTAVGSVLSSIDGMSDASDEALQGLTASALDFAAAFEVDVARAVSVAGTLMESGLAESGEEAFDLLTHASQRVPAALREDLLDATEEYGQFFNALGFSGAQAFNLLVDQSAKGMYGIDKAGDAIKEFAIRSTDGSKLSASAFEAIGLDMDKMATKILAGGDEANEAFFKIISGLQGIKNPTDQAAAAIALFGTPLEDLGATEIPKFLESLSMGAEGFGEFEGAAKEMGTTLADNAQTDLVAFKRSMEQNVANSLQPVIGLLRDLPGPAETAISTLMGFASLAAPIGPFLLALTTMIPLIKSWELATKAQAVAQWYANTAMAAFPLTWILLGIAAIIAVIVLIVKNWDTLREAAVKAWDFIWGKIQAFASWYWGLYTGTFQAIRDGIVAGINWVRDRWNSAWQAIQSGAASVVSWIGSIPGKIGGFFSNVASIITSPFRSAFNGIARLWNGTVGRISFSIPAWVPMIGGRSFSVPDIPMLAAGGIFDTAGLAMVGERGPELVNLPRGAQVSPLDGNGAGGSRVTLELVGDEAMVQMFRKMVRVRGGNVQVVLGQ